MATNTKKNGHQLTEWMQPNNWAVTKVSTRIIKCLIKIVGVGTTTAVTISTIKQCKP